MVKTAGLDAYFNMRMGAEILKAVIKTANISDDKKDRVLTKLSKDLAADKIAAYLEKKSSPVKALKWPFILGTPLAVGASLPTLAQRADTYHRQSMRPVNAQMYDLRMKRAQENAPLSHILGSMGAGFGPDFLREMSKGVASQPLSALSHKLSKNLYNLSTRIQPEETYGISLYKNLGKDTSSLLMQHAQDQLKKQQSLTIDKNVYSPMRKQIFDTLVTGRQADPTIAQAISEGRTDVDKLWNLYKTMVRFAPKLSTDINAVKTYFRDVLHLGDGETVNHVLIKQLADTESAINKAMEGVI